MDTEIGYLNALYEDLRAAGARESLQRARHMASAPRRRSTRPASSRRRRIVWRLSAGVAAIAVAGAIGAVATDGGELAQTGGYTAASPAAGAGTHSEVPTSLGRSLNDRSAPSAGVPTKAAPGAGAAASGGSVADSGPAPAPVGSGGVGSGSLGAQSVGGGIPEVSKVVKTADLSIVVAPSSFPARFQAATELADELGGFVQSSSEGARSGHLVMRVPARSFNAARRELKALGVSVARETIDGQDVTAQFVDLKARLEILQARKDALLALLHRATTLEAILRLQNVVDDVLTRIEELKGQINLINDQTSNATISVTMREKGVQLTPRVDKPSLGSALSHGVAGFLSVVYLIVVGLGYLVPLGILALFAWLVVRMSRRRQASSASAGA